MSPATTTSSRGIPTQDPMTATYSPQPNGEGSDGHSAIACLDAQWSILHPSSSSLHTLGQPPALGPQSYPRYGEDPQPSFVTKTSVSPIPLAESSSKPIRTPHGTQLISHQPHFDLPADVQRLLARAHSLRRVAYRASSEPCRQASNATSLPTPTSIGDDLGIKDLPPSAHGVLTSAGANSSSLAGGAVSRGSQETWKAASDSGFHFPYERPDCQLRQFPRPQSRAADPTAVRDRPSRPAHVIRAEAARVDAMASLGMDPTITRAPQSMNAAECPVAAHSESAASVIGVRAQRRSGTANTLIEPSSLWRDPTQTLLACERAGCRGVALPQPYHDEYHRTEALVANGQIPLPPLLFAFQTMRANMDALQAQHAHLMQMYDQMRHGHLKLQQHSQKLMMTLHGVQAVLTQHNTSETLGISEGGRAGYGEAGYGEALKPPKRARRI